MSEPALPVLDATAVRAIERRLLRAAPGLDVGWLARQVAARMAERLEIIKVEPRHVLDASGWLGQGRAALQRRYPKARISTLERHDEAIRRHDARAPSRWWTPWRRSGPANSAMPAGVIGPSAHLADPVQLLFSNLDLHARADPAAEFADWYQAVEPGGFVMFSTLGPASCRELRLWHEALGFGPATIPFVDMHDHGDLLVQAGFADPVMDQELLTLTWADAAAALRDLRALGGNAHPGRFSGLRTPRWQRRLEAAWNAHAGPDGRLAITVEVAYGHAFRVHRATRVPSEGHITVDALRATARGRSPQSPGGRDS